MQLPCPVQFLVIRWHESIEAKQAGKIPLLVTFDDEFEVLKSEDTPAAEAAMSDSIVEKRESSEPAA